MRRETLRDDNQTRIGTTKKLIVLRKKCGGRKCSSLVVKLSFSCRISLIPHRLHSKSLWFSLPCAEVELGCSSFVVPNWRIPSQNGNLLLRFEQSKNKIIVSLPIDRMDCSLHDIWSYCWLVFPFISPSFYCALWSAFGLPRISSFSHSTSLRLLLIKTQLQKAFSLSAGVTKGVTSPAAHRSIWHSAGATKSWFHSATLKKSLALIKSGLKATEVVYLIDRRNAQRSQWHTN